MNNSFVNYKKNRIFSGFDWISNGVADLFKSRTLQIIGLFVLTLNTLLYFGGDYMVNIKPESIQSSNVDISISSIMLLMVFYILTLSKVLSPLIYIKYIENKKIFKSIISSFGGWTLVSLLSSFSVIVILTILASAFVIREEDFQLLSEVLTKIKTVPSYQVDENLIYKFLIKIGILSLIMSIISFIQMYVFYINEKSKDKYSFLFSNKLGAIMFFKNILPLSIMFFSLVFLFVVKETSVSYFNFEWYGSIVLDSLFYTLFISIFYRSTVDLLVDEKEI